MLFLIGYLLLLIILLFFLIFLSIYTFSLIYSSSKGAPYVPTNRKTILEILKESNLKKGKTFIELGSGDGRVTRLAVERFGVKGIGFDINPLLVFWSNFLAKLTIKDGQRIIFVRKNILEANLNHADYLYLFLLPDLIKKIKPKFEKELKKGTIIISHGFPILGWEKKCVKKIANNPFPTYYYKR